MEEREKIFIPCLDLQLPSQKIDPSHSEHLRFKNKREREKFCPPWLQLQLPSQEMGQSHSEHLRF